MANTLTFTINLDGNAQPEVEKLINQVSRLNGKVEGASGLFEGLKNKAFAFNAIAELVGKVGNAFDSLLGTSLQFEQQQANLRTLLDGDAKATDRLVDSIREYGKATVYDRSGLVEAQKTMMAFGLNADFAFGKLKNIGDIALGDSQKMQSLALAFAQATSTGKLMGQDLLQMINAGFNPLEEISRKTGTSMAELKEQMGKGAISAELVAQAFEWATAEGGRFYQGAESAAETTAGKIAKMRDSIDDMKISLFEATGGATAWIAELGGMFEPMAVCVPLFEYMGKVPALFRKIAAACTITNLKLMAQDFWLNVLIVKEKLMAVATGIWTAAQKLLNAVLSANPIGLVIAAIALLAGVITMIVRKYDQWGAAATLLMGPLGAVINVVQSFRRHWDSIVEAFQTDGIIAGLKRIGLVLLDAMLMPVQQLLNMIAKIPGLANLATKGADKIADMRRRLSLDSPAMQAADKAVGANSALEKAVNTGSSAPSRLATPTAARTTEAVATGGTRNTTVNISLDSMVGQIVYNSSARESAADVQRLFAEQLNRVLGMAQATI